MDLDSLIIIARHFKWNKNKMNAWFAQQETLKYELGLEVDPNVSKKFPDTVYSLPEMHGGYCPICYEEISEDNSFSLECGHTFCHACWKDYL